MPENVTNIDKLKQKLLTISVSAKKYREQVAILKAKKEAQLAEPFETSTPLQSTRGDTLPSDSTVPL